MFCSPTDIQKADFLSRFIDIDDWQVTRECFDTLERLWGYHTIDCFANYYNTKTSRFISWHWNPGCTGVDFFVQNLSGENCLVVPPISLITRALYYLQTQKAQATVIVPFWTSSYFWPVITRHLMHYVLDYKVFNGKQALQHVRNTNALLGSDRFYGEIIAFRMEFN